MSDERNATQSTPSPQVTDATARYNLGFCYDNGIGVEKDIKKAIALYQAAADQGHATAREE